MSYVDGFVIVLPKKNIEDYKKMAELGSATWKKHGALDYKECVGDDLSSEFNEQGNSFPKLLNLTEEETVIFSYIVYRDRAHRDEVNKLVMSDPSMSPEEFKDKPMPFEMKKMSTGGFQTIVEW